ncbi:oligosaccharide flippase family protein [Acinetobacter baumannii]|uniref:oligosaccharide flippase family protein n=1 Tax=Acinetobacter baumannii TaxID=470 RepID=UPI000BF6A1E2|nr:oligosaccharide flippase family protein [Acinetobacter baumannii]MDC4648450.1 oligosaccharide flippase family protein [Acinetobacter baumannii]MDC5061348.1 oligosaccharide flippase family protein [Acinetobacter baumannii]MDC5220034.1 oligosaccharide flippase family protein [Acinetobacter baumannii]MDC5496591.1 oligosaccharide flippase family protein [Acinetobacter baumannii]MDH2524173.1 oligosaccharide flippase family protein [Acinetobacter baumannii]
MKKLINLGLRGLTVLFKASLIFYIAKELNTSDMAIYGVFAAIITYFMYFVGLDFYTYYTREIADIDPKEWFKYIKNTSYLFSVMYLLAIPLLYLIIYFKILELKFIFIFIFILFAEHINQEICRLLIMKQSVLLSSFLTFVRSAAWAPIILLLMYLNIVNKNIENILYAWAVADFTCLIMGVYIIAKIIDFPFEKSKVDFYWIKKGIIICIPFLIGTLAIRGVSTFDKIWLQKYFSQEFLASYSFFSSFSTVVFTIVDALVLSYTYPNLIRLFKNKNNSLYNKEIKRMLISVSGISAISCFIMYFATLIFLNIMKLNQYLNDINIFVIMLVGVFLNCIGMIPHYILYSQGVDKSIYYTHIVTFILFLTFLFILTPLFGGYIVPLLVLFFYLILVVVKSYLTYLKCEFN